MLVIAEMYKEAGKLSENDRHKRLSVQNFHTLFVYPSNDQEPDR